MICPVCHKNKQNIMRTITGNICSDCHDAIAHKETCPSFIGKSAVCTCSWTKPEDIVKNKSEGMRLPEWQKVIHANAVEKGWWEEERQMGEMLANVHSEISEAWEHWRNGKPDVFVGPDGKPDGLMVELADAVIRILDIAESRGCNLEVIMMDKHNYNKTRPYRHGGKKA